MTREQIQLIITGDAKSAVAANRAVGKSSRAAEKQTVGSYTAMSKGVDALKGAVMAYISIAGARRIASGIDQLATQLDDIGKGAKQLQITAEEFQRLSFAAERSGASATAIKMAFKGMDMILDQARDGLVEGKRALDKLGISLEDLDGKSRAEQFRLIAEALSEVEDKSLKGALAQKFFGRSGAALLPMLDNLNDLTGQLDEVNGVISDESVAAAEDYKDAMLDLKKAITATVSDSGLITWAAHVAEGLGAVIRNTKLAEATFLDMVDTAATFNPAMWAAKPFLKHTIKKLDASREQDALDKFAADQPAEVAARKKAAAEAARRQAARAAAREQAAAVRQAAEAKAKIDKAAKAREDAAVRRAKKAAAEIARLGEKEAAVTTAMADAEAARAKATSRDTELKQLQDAIDLKRDEITLSKQAADAAEKEAAAAKQKADAQWKNVVHGKTPAGAEKLSARDQRAADRAAAKKAAAESAAETKAQNDLADARMRQREGFSLSGHQKDLLNAADAKSRAAGQVEFAKGEALKAQMAKDELAAAQKAKDDAIAKFAETDYQAGVDEQVAKLQEIRDAIATLAKEGLDQEGRSRPGSPYPGSPPPGSPSGSAPAPLLPPAPSAAGLDTGKLLSTIAANTANTAAAIKALNLGMTA